MRWQSQYEFAATIAMAANRINEPWELTNCPTMSTNYVRKGTNAGKNGPQDFLFSLRLVSVVGAACVYYCMSVVLGGIRDESEFSRIRLRTKRSELQRLGNDWDNRSILGILDW